MPIRVPVSPAFALLDDHLLIGSHPKVILAALKQRSETDDSLATAEDFVAATRANRDASAFLHLRQGRGLELGWRLIDTYLLKPLDGMQDQVGFGRDSVPEQEQLVNAAGTTTLCATVDDAGVRFTARGNLGLGGLLVGGASLFDELLQRAAGKIY